MLVLSFGAGLSIVQLTKSEKKKNIHNNNLPINCTYHDKLYADGRTVQDVQI